MQNELLCSITGTLKKREEGPKFSAASIANLTNCVSAYEFSMASVINGTISLADYQLLQPHMTNAIELCEISDALRTKADDLKLAFSRRKAELSCFTKFVSNFSEFWQLCKTSFKGNEDGL